MASWPMEAGAREKWSLVLSSQPRLRGMPLKFFAKRTCAQTCAHAQRMNIAVSGQWQERMYVGISQIDCRYHVLSLQVLLMRGPWKQTFTFCLVYMLCTNFTIMR